MENLDKMIARLFDYKDTLENILENGQCELLGWEEEAVEMEIKELEELTNGY